MKSITTLSTLLILLLATDSALSYYSPGAGRWLSRDPIGERGGVGLFSFLRNNPISLTDPLGLCPAPYCKCVSVEIEFHPASEDKKFRWSITAGETKDDKVQKLGNNIHITWKVEGERSRCQFRQDESAVENSAGYDRNDYEKIRPQIKYGQDNPIPLERFNENGTYGDRLGVPLDSVGFYYMRVTGKFVFKCSGTIGEPRSKTLNLDAWGIAASRRGASSVIAQDVRKCEIQ